MQSEHEIYEKARKRVKQKRWLYYHFIVFVLGLIFIFTLNSIFALEEKIFANWHIVAVIVWTFLFLLHVVNVFITNRFFGKEWERIQTEKLISKHNIKAEKFEKQFIKEHQLKQETAQQHKQLQLEQLQILLQELFQPTNTLLISLSRIQQQQAALQQQLEKKDSMVNATEAEKAKLEAEFDVAREAHNEEVEKLKSHYEVITVCSTPKTCPTFRPLVLTCYFGELKCYRLVLVISTLH